MLVEIQDIDSLFHITEPWYINHCKFDDQKEQLDVFVCIRKGALFCCSKLW
jgi:transposase